MCLYIVILHQRICFGVCFQLSRMVVILLKIPHSICFRINTYMVPIPMNMIKCAEITLFDCYAPANKHTLDVSIPPFVDHLPNRKPLVFQINGCPRVTGQLLSFCLIFQHLSTLFIGIPLQSHSIPLSPLYSIGTLLIGLSLLELQMSRKIPLFSAQPRLGARRPWVSKTTTRDLARRRISCCPAKCIAHMV